MIFHSGRSYWPVHSGQGAANRQGAPVRFAKPLLPLWLLGMAACAATSVVAQDHPADRRYVEAAAGEAAPVSPPILSREKWHAKPALPGLKRQTVAGIILHHTAVRQDPRASLEKKMRGLQSFSQRPGQVSLTHGKPAWPDVPYHFYVDVSGRIAEGRDVSFAGDTNTNYNPSGYIQVVIEGDFEKETPDPAQLAALRELLVWMALNWDIPGDKITVHKSHASTSCPGKNFMAVLPDLLTQVAQQRRKVVEDYCAGLPGDARPAVCEREAAAPKRAGLAPAR